MDKIHRYTPLVNYFRGQDYNCEVEAFIILSLMSHDHLNERVIKKLNINRRFAKAMRHLMVADATRHNRDIHVNHVEIRPASGFLRDSDLLAL